MRRFAISIIVIAIFGGTYFKEATKWQDQKKVSNTIIIEKEIPSSPSVKADVFQLDHLDQARNQLEIVEKQLEREGFPEILNRTYLTPEERNRLNQMVSKAQKLRSRYFRLWIKQINQGVGS